MDRALLAVFSVLVTVDGLPLKPAAVEDGEVKIEEGWLTGAGAVGIEKYSTAGSGQ
jgi:hypothetical protein